MKSQTKPTLKEISILHKQCQKQKDRITTLEKNISTEVSQQKILKEQLEQSSINLNRYEGELDKLKKHNSELVSFLEKRQAEFKNLEQNFDEESKLIGKQKSRYIGNTKPIRRKSKKRKSKKDLKIKQLQKEIKKHDKSHQEKEKPALTLEEQIRFRQKVQTNLKRMSLMKDIQKGKKLKKVPTYKKRYNSRMTLMTEIREKKSTRLRKVPKNEIKHPRAFLMREIRHFDFSQIKSDQTEPKEKSEEPEEPEKQQE